MTVKRRSRRRLTPAKSSTYSRRNGWVHSLIGEIRLSQRVVALEIKEAADAVPRVEIGLVAQPPLDMPVPQSPAGPTKPASPSLPSPSGGGGAIAKPTIIER